MDNSERQILQILDNLLKDNTVRAKIEPIVLRVKEIIAQNPDRQMAWEAIPLSVYGAELSSSILSSWVFIIRANVISGFERHPNSRQRMISYDGAGCMQVGIGNEWQSHFMVSDFNAPFENRWISIAPLVWHQVVTQNGVWAVISFHSVPAEELIEERFDEDNPGQTKQKKYLD